jgi:hypothetical protein
MSVVEDNSCNCSICFESIVEKKDSMTTKCGHTFHTSCFLPWIYQGKKECPYCRNNIVDIEDLSHKTRYIRSINNNELYYTIICDPNNLRNQIRLIKKKINNINYYISINNSNRVFFTPLASEFNIDFWRSDNNNHYLLNFYLEEIGTFDWDSNTISYEYNVKLLTIDDTKFLVDQDNFVYSYENHTLVGKYNDLENKIIYYIEDCNSRKCTIIKNSIKEKYHSEDKNFVTEPYFYFKGRIYRKDNGNNVDLSLMINHYEDI